MLFRSKLGIILTNKHLQQDFKVKITLENVKPNAEGQLWLLTGDALTDQNDGVPNKVKIKQFKMADISESFIYTIPARSVSALEIHLGGNP